MKILHQKTKIDKIILDADEFISIWKGEKLQDPKYSHFYEDGRIEISNPDNTISNGEKRKCAIFRKIEVNGMVRLIDENITYPPINISGCIFNDTFQIQKGTFENFRVGVNPGENIFKKGLNILGGNFNNSAKFGSIGSSNEEKYSSLKIHGGNFTSKVRIWGSKNCELEITNGIFKGGISLNGNFYDIRISGGTYYSDVELESLYCENSLQFIGDAKSKIRTTDIENEWIDAEFPKFINFIDSGILVLGEIIINKSFIISYIDCNYLKFSIATVKHINSHYSCFIDDLQLIEFNKDVFISSRNDLSILINSLTFSSCTTFNSSTIRLDNLNLNSLTIDKHINLGNFIINNIFVNHYYSSNFENNKKNEIYINKKKFFELLKKINRKAKIYLKLSDLGKTKFFNCNLADSEVYFESSIVSNIFLIDTKLPNEIASVDNDYNQIKIGYGQIKKAYLNTGDSLVANDYLVKEIQSFQNLLKSTKSNKKDRIILSLNKISSNHGQDWFQGLIFTLLSGLLIFLIYISVIPERPFYWGWSGFNQFWIATKETLKYFPEFLYPGHSFDFMSKKYLGWTLVIDLIGRIFIGYGIYQTIQSFRKYRMKI
ncbi:hypothetical protein [Winogradskyella sediminis]|uniref:hypothetical protein n=1 Tax=Winogradskyella sediminis TaxID=1382466 RepID=UPI003AA92721